MSTTEYRIVSADLLAEFRSRGDQPEFWASQWREVDYTRYLERYESGYLAQFERVFTRHLPRGSRILEAGCGRGQYVVALRRRGFDAVGVDFSADLIQALRKAKPSLPIDLGDVRNLPYPDETFGAYVSLGVIEHFRDEAPVILREARRVLKAGGLALVSVPHFSPSWRKRALKGEATSREDEQPAEGDFYQFYFSTNEFVARMKEARFEPLELYFYDALYGAKRAFPLFDRVYGSAYVIRGILNRLFKFPMPQWLQRHFAHMIMVVGRRQ